MTDRQVPIAINGKRVLVTPGTSVAAAAMIADQPCRKSIHGAPRAPLCGMGICMECRMTIDGIPHRRSCQVLCAPGMEAITG